jgi:acetyltransferase-like isoleucine patch superfamily enzyme
LRAKVRVIVNGRIGIRTLWKSLNVYLRGKGYENGRSLGNFLLNGNTRVSLAKNIRIINKGTLTVGLHPEDFHVSTNPCIIGMGENSKIVINGLCRVGLGVTLVLLKNASLEFGDDVYINSNSTIVCSEHVEIGDGSRISWNVEICDTDFHRMLRNGSVVSKPIEIGRNVLIGCRAMILKGVKVGNGSVIAAGAIVTRDVPANCLVAGVPAKVIKKEIKWE